MEWRRSLTSEEEEARSKQRLEMLRMTKEIQRLAEDPMANADVAPHLVGRTR